MNASDPTASPCECEHRVNPTSTQMAIRRHFSRVKSSPRIALLWMALMSMARYLCGWMNASNPRPTIDSPCECEHNNPSEKMPRPWSQQTRQLTSRRGTVAHPGNRGCFVHIHTGNRSPTSTQMEMRTSLPGQP